MANFLPCPSIAPILGEQLSCNRPYTHEGLCLNYGVGVYWCWPCGAFNCEHSTPDQISNNVGSQIAYNVYSRKIKEAAEKSFSNSTSILESLLEDSSLDTQEEV